LPSATSFNAIEIGFGIALSKRSKQAISICGELFVKQSLKATLLVPAALIGSLAAQTETPQRQPPPESQRERTAEQTVKGTIAATDDGRYILVDPMGTAYHLDDQAAAKKFVGKKVKVSGAVDAAKGTIHVTDIKTSS